jgi:hypothetical protein
MGMACYVWIGLNTVRNWTSSSLTIHSHNMNSVLHPCPKWDLNSWSQWAATEIGISPGLWTWFCMSIARVLLVDIERLVDCWLRALGLALSVWLTWLAGALLHSCNSIAVLKGRKLTPIYRMIQEENSVFLEMIMCVMCPIRNCYRDSAVWIVTEIVLFESADTKALRIARERLLTSFYSSFYSMFQLKNLLHSYDKLWVATAQSV